MKYKKSIFYLLAIFALIAMGVFALVRIPPKANVTAFNKWYKTALSDREIYYSKSGFVDSEFHAAIPMSYDEFIETAKVIGMTKATLAARQQCGDRPWWSQAPKSDVFILDRIRQSTHRDYIEGHFDPTKQTAYFTYFDH
jgi:hypothetical protein